jgi:hypothetical protein
LVGKPEGKSLLGRPSCRREDNIRMNLKEIDWYVWIGCIWLMIGPVAVFYDYSNELSGSIKGGEFLN